MTAKYGTPYFSNYVNSDMKPSDIRSMCCRLRLDLTELRRKNGGFFGSGESTGSIGVVTLNMPRLAYTSKNKEDFYKKLDRLMDVAARSLDTKRKVVTQLLDNGLYPYTKRYLGHFNNHFSTIGLVGMNECCLNAKWLRQSIDKPEAQEFTKEVLNHMRDRLVQYQEKYKCLFNLEATPAESTTYRFAKHDKEDFPDIITAAKDGMDPFYTNSSHLPVDYTNDIFEALDIQDQFQTLYTSGTVFHCFLGEKLPDWKAAANLVKKISDNYKLPYYTMSPTYSVCPDHGYITGEHWTCPKCGKKTEVWSRITGYYRPVRNWNAGKTSEFNTRKEYSEEESMKNFYNEVHGVQSENNNCHDGVCSLNRDKSTGYDKPVMFIQDHCPKCKGAEQRFNAMKIDYEIVNCTSNPEVIDKFALDETPTIINPDGKRYVGANAAVEWLKENKH